jgi:hypothetical protein
MKRTVLVLIFILALLFSEAAGTQFVTVTEAQQQNSTVMIQTPENKTNGTNTVSVNTFACHGSRALAKIAYQLDNSPEVTVYTYHRTINMGDFQHMGRGNATLQNLPDGPHHLRAIASWVW